MIPCIAVFTFLGIGSLFVCRSQSRFLLYTGAVFRKFCLVRSDSRSCSSLEGYRPAGESACLIKSFYALPTRRYTYPSLDVVSSPLFA
jgi:hypothetical protein